MSGQTPHSVNTGFTNNIMPDGLVSGQSSYFGASNGAAQLNSGVRFRNRINSMDTQNVHPYLKQQGGGPESHNYNQRAVPSFNSNVFQ